MSEIKGPTLIKTVDGKEYLALAGGQSVEIDGLRKWYVAVNFDHLRGAKIKPGHSFEFPIVAVVDVIK